MRFTEQKKRGISPVVAALLLVVIVVAGFSVLYATTDNWIRAQRRNEFFYMQERFVIEDIWFRTSGGTRSLVTVFLRNNGGVDLNVTQVKIDDTTYTNTPGGLELNPDLAGGMNVTFSWTPDTTYKIELKTARGYIVTAYETG